MLTVDFESKGIEGNPIYNPPEPVGVSIKEEGEKSVYLCWGHPTKNNSSFEVAKAILLEKLDRADRKDSDGWLAHNAPFECAILRKYSGWEPKYPEKVHDSQYLIFLHDPYANSFSLKPSAERILGMPPDEQDDLKAWILSNVKGAKESDWGAYIWLAPGDLVGRYAEGDTDRTYLLYQHLMPRIQDLGMERAYVREQLLMPILSESSVRGVRVDYEKLERDIGIYRKAQKISDDYIFSRLGEFDMAKDAQLADALDRAGMVKEWVLTPTGRRSVARKNLVGRVSDPDILRHLAYRGVLETCIGTFGEPWLAQALAEGGRVHPQWNQVRGDRGSDGDISGTRTGRMSCKRPNLQNPPNDFEGLEIPQQIRDFIARERLQWNSDITEVMHLRSYLLPEEGHTWLKRDFSSQEMRILAHFSEGKLYEEFWKNPKADPHAVVSALIKEHSGVELSRKYVKITGFGIMYGRGVASTAAALGVSDDEGRSVRDAYFAALPEVRELSLATRNRGRAGEFIRTWGGRIYYREPNPERDLSYKLLNYLIQGSAADQTKQSAIDWYHIRKPTEHLIAMVHDEFNISAPIGEEQDAMHRLRVAMDSPRFDVPFSSDGFSGQNWADIIKWSEQ